MNHLRYDNGNGTSKDWIIEVNANGGLTIQFGRTGSTLRRTEIPASACSGGASTEMQKRMQEKLDKGYQFVQDPSDPAAQKAREKMEKEAQARQAQERMAKLKAANAPPPTWF